MSQQHNLYAGSGDGGNHQPRGFAADVSWRHFHPQFMLTSYPSPPTPAVSLPGVPGPSVGVPYHYQTQAIPAQSINKSVGPYKYVVRIINPEQKSKHVTKVWHNITEKFSTCDQLKLKLIECFEDKLPTFSELQLGYMERGAKRWIENNQDLDSMYKTFCSTDEITLWCGGTPTEKQKRETKKRKLEDVQSCDKSSCKRSARDQKLEEIVQTLRNKHGENYSGPQFRIWARMYLNSQHSSLDVAPSIPIFTGSTTSKPQKNESLSDALTTAATAIVGILKGNPTSECPGDTESSAIVTTMSPGKRARVSGQYLEQLERLKALQTSGVLTCEEFEEQKSYTLNNIRQLNK